MATELVGGPYDGLRYNGPFDPTIIMQDDQGRHHLYDLDQTGRYRHRQDDTPELFKDEPPEGDRSA